MHQAPWSIVKAGRNTIWDVVAARMYKVAVEVYVFAGMELGKILAGNGEGNQPEQKSDGSCIRRLWKSE